MQKKEIHSRIYKFVLNVLETVKSIPRTTENLVLIKQVVRSSSSIGANASEADGAESKKEFIHRFIIAKKEAKETVFWLMLLADHNKQRSNFLSLIQENNEIVAIISKIVMNAQRNVK